MMPDQSQLRTLAAACAVVLPGLVQPAMAQASPVGVSFHADFVAEQPSAAARQVADWALSSHDHGTMPFVIIDKVQAKVYVFGSDGRLRGATRALLGLARGDDSAPDIGTLSLKDITPAERTTPAGRFVASLGRDLHTDILWVDYKLALSMHRVVQGLPGDQRLRRLGTTGTLDKRISFGCINVPAAFFDDVVLKAFTGTQGVVYILPEVKSLRAVFTFASTDVSIR